MFKKLFFIMALSIGMSTKSIEYQFCNTLLSDLPEIDSISQGVRSSLGCFDWIEECEFLILQESTQKVEKWLKDRYRKLIGALIFIRGNVKL